MTTAEAAEALRCSVDKIQRHLADGSLHGIKVGGRWLLARDVVEQLTAAAK